MVVKLMFFGKEGHRAWITAIEHPAAAGTIANPHIPEVAIDGTRALHQLIKSLYNVLIPSAIGDLDLAHSAALSRGLVRPAKIPVL